MESSFFCFECPCICICIVMLDLNLELMSSLIHDISVQMGIIGRRGKWQNKDVIVSHDNLISYVLLLM